MSGVSWLRQKWDLRRPLVLVVFLLAVSACSTQPRVQTETGISIPAPTAIHVVRDGWHTGFVVPSDTIQSRLPQLRERFGEVPYLEFGWGDKKYYESEEVKSGLITRAILWPTDSVMRVVSVPQDPVIFFAEQELETLCLDARHYALLIAFIERSFEKDHSGNIIKSRDGFEGDSRFFDGVGRYYMINTCNNWTARGLKSAGLDISPAFKQTAGSITGYLRKYTLAPPRGSCATKGAEARQ